MGKGAAELRSPQRKQMMDKKDRQTLQTSLRGIANRVITECKASSSEEPGAVVPHAGICAGGHPVMGVPYREQLSAAMQGMEHRAANLTGTAGPPRRTTFARDKLRTCSALPAALTP